LQFYIIGGAGILFNKHIYFNAQYENGDGILDYFNFGSDISAIK
jgi:hypothetical protein